MGNGLPMHLAIAPARSVLVATSSGSSLTLTWFAQSGGLKALLSTNFVIKFYRPSDQKDKNSFLIYFYP